MKQILFRLRNFTLKPNIGESRHMTNICMEHLPQFALHQVELKCFDQFYVTKIGLSEAIFFTVKIIYLTAAAPSVTAKKVDFVSPAFF